VGDADPFLSETKALLTRTPQVLRGLLEGLPDVWLEGRDTPEGWQPRDVVGHLITAELDDWIPRIKRILEDGTTKPFEKFDRHAMLERDRGVLLDELLDRFEELRAQNLTTLDELVTDADLDKPGYHPSLGNVTMRNLLATWAIHDLDHTSQVFAGMSAAYDQTVGSWKHYLGILLRREDPSAIPG
jgi:hypothetical protein